MSIRHPKEKKFLYIAGLLLALGAFDLYMVFFVVGKTGSFFGVFATMVFVNAIGFVGIGIALILILISRFKHNRREMWKDIVSEGIKRGNEESFPSDRSQE